RQTEEEQVQPHQQRNRTEQLQIEAQQRIQRTPVGRAEHAIEHPAQGAAENRRQGDAQRLDRATTQLRRHLPEQLKTRTGHAATAFRAREATATAARAAARRARSSPPSSRRFSNTARCSSWWCRAAPAPPPPRPRWFP